MPSDIPGLGTLLQIDIATVYTTIGQRVSIKGPSMEMGKVETTTLDSTYKEYRPTLADGGELSCQLFYDPTDATTHQVLYGLLTTKAITSFKLIFAVAGPNNTFTFNAFLTKFEPGGMEPEGNLTADIAFQLIGVPVQS